MDRKKQMQFHIEKDDYFGSLATVLDLYVQTLERGERGMDDHSECLKRLSDDLMFLQENYKIVRK